MNRRWKRAVPELGSSSTAIVAVSTVAGNTDRAILARAGAVQSMSARANPYHNAWTESFMGTLKGEMLQGGCFADERDARVEIFDFIEAYYNTHRKHSSLGYLTPAKFEAGLNTIN